MVEDNFMAAVMGGQYQAHRAHSHPHTSAMVTARGFSCSRLPRNLGYSTFSAIKCSPNTTMITTTAPELMCPMLTKWRHMASTTRDKERG